MFETRKRERRIRIVLRRLAGQRVAAVLQPSGGWLIEQALQRNDEVEADLQTCVMRGWAEVLHENIPTGDLDDNFRLKPGPMFTRKETIYRLTEGGWAALNRAHAWTLANTLIAVVALIASLMFANG